MLNRLLPPTGVAASFEDDFMRVGVVKLADARMVALFNWEDQPQTFSFRLSEASYITDYWTGESLARHEGVFTVKDLPAHSARLLVCKR
jgi:alpha-galactosidase